jgi:hypothetical protein
MVEMQRRLVPGRWTPPLGLSPPPPHRGSYGVDRTTTPTSPRIEEAPPLAPTLARPPCCGPLHTLAPAAP